MKRAKRKRKIRRLGLIAGKLTGYLGLPLIGLPFGGMILVQPFFELIAIDQGQNKRQEAETQDHEKNTVLFGSNRLTLKG